MRRLPILIAVGNWPIRGGESSGFGMSVYLRGHRCVSHEARKERKQNNEQKGQIRE